MDGMQGPASTNRRLGFGLSVAELGSQRFKRRVGCCVQRAIAGATGIPRLSGLWVFV
jgi:hypothetical protein